ncbi:hypothetical protein NPIL_444761 [Nephila pilipes]|uniref:Uncharacterized protein n=1 Tax=Nephila pilipes TaxID=299642 RepID=A0A8X6MSH0_NEPPI|nr:hypothetical protein NPIL_444761 [Nephila pilipes]
MIIPERSHHLPLSVLVWNPPLLTFIVVIPPIINTILDHFPMDDSSSVPPNPSTLPSYNTCLVILIGETPGDEQAFLLLEVFEEKP